MFRNAIVMLAFGALLTGCRPSATRTLDPDATSVGPATSGPLAPTTDGNAGVGAAAGSVPRASVAATPAETPDATLEALYATFEPPMRGDPSAPLLLYEFSDYL